MNGLLIICSTGVLSIYAPYIGLVIIITYSLNKARDLYRKINTMHLVGYLASLLIGISLEDTCQPP